MNAKQHHTGQIFFCGDCHGRFEHIIAAVQEHRRDAVILLGDMEAPCAP